MDDQDWIVALGTAQRRLRQAEATVSRLRQTRDDLIRTALRDGMTAYRVAAVLGVTQRAVHKIRDAKPLD